MSAVPWYARFRYLADKRGMTYTHSEPNWNAFQKWMGSKSGQIEVITMWKEGEKPRPGPGIPKSPPHRSDIAAAAPPTTGLEAKAQDITHTDEPPMPKVFHKFRDAHRIPPGSVYVGRPSKWGNPFKLEEFQSREDCIEAFRLWVFATEQAQLRKDAQQELKNRNLVCFCAPLACHADVWLEIANE